VTGGVADCSAGRVVVPDRLKFCSSRGPIASVAGVLVVAGSVVFWASATAGAKHNPPANKIVLKRKPALIRSRSVLESPLLSRSASRPCPPLACYSSIWRMNGAGTRLTEL
jgi:hypothetical protein